MKKNIFVTLLVLAATSVSFAGQSIYKKSIAVDDRCVRDYSKDKESVEIEAQTDDQKRFLVEAVEVAKSAAADHELKPQYVAYKSIQKYKYGLGFSAQVLVCDEAEEQEEGQGNCLSFTFRESIKENSPAKIAAIEEMWHIGHGKVYFVCQ